MKKFIFAMILGVSLVACNNKQAKTVEVEEIDSIELVIQDTVIIDTCYQDSIVCSL